MLRLLSSTKLTVALCLVLAAAGIAGSLLYQGNTAFGKPAAFNIYRSPLFLAPAGMLIVNILFCAARRLRGLPVRARRTWTFAGIHAGLVLLAGGLVADGLYGFVATQYFHPGVPTSGYYNWRTQRDESFPFTVEVVDSRTEFHPTNLQIGLRDASGNKLGPFTVRVGGSFAAGDPPVTVAPKAFDAETKTVLFDARAEGRTHAGLTAGKDGSVPVGGYVVVPVAFANPEPQDFVTRVRFTDAGRAAVERVIRVNHPVEFSGISFCFVERRADEYRNEIVGLQMTREPGEPAFWAGGILFGLSLLMHLLPLRRAPAGAGAAAEPETGSGHRAVRGAAATLLALSAIFAPHPPALAGETRSGDPAAGRPYGAVLAGEGRAISGEESWEGVVRVTSPVTVERGGTLRILPGATVLLSGEDRDGDGCRDGYIQVFGTLIVAGEEGRPVSFRRLDPDKQWEEVFLLDARAEIRGARFEGGTWGLHVHDGEVRVEETTFRGNGGGARLTGSGASFSRCTFRENGVALRFRDGGPTVTASVLEDNGVGLFYREGSGGGKVSGSVLANREWDLKIGDWAAGALDVSGNCWGGAGTAGTRMRIGDFRERKEEGAIRLLPASECPPAAGGTSGGRAR